MDDLVVDAFAAARLTRLVTTDTFPPVKALRERWVREFGQGSSLSELIECGWCAGFWITAAVRVARRVAPRWWGPVADVFAAAMVASYLVGKSTEEGDPQDVAEAIEGRLKSASLHTSDPGLGGTVPTGGHYTRQDAAQLNLRVAGARTLERRLKSVEEMLSMGRHPTGMDERQGE